MASDLSKGFASAWLQRAGHLATVGANAAGDLGAKAGAAIERHSPAGRDMRATAAGARSGPRSSAGRAMEQRASIAGANGYHASVLRASSENKTAMGRGGPGHPRTTEAHERQFDRASLPHGVAASDAARQSRQQSISDHAAAYARFGRRAAHWGFRAGIAAAGGAAVGAAAKTRALTQKEHDERVAAARARWSGKGIER